ncbi:MAG: CsgG/HfaB family protein [Phycisphaerales bacterium]|nr:CsgG/HfaB family protein [Phycisphaerales bacterium]
MRHYMSTVLILATLLIGSHAQAQQGTKPRIAVQNIQATPAVMEKATRDGSQNVLEQVLQATDPALINYLQKSGRFQVVAGSDLEKILNAQDVQRSGFYDTSDPETAQSFKLKGFKYIATVTVTSFQLITRTATIPDAMGQSKYTYETIQLGAMLKIYDVTQGTVLGTAAFTTEHEEETRLIEGAEQTGAFSNRMINFASMEFASDATSEILNSLSPAKVIGFQNNVVFFNRGESTGVAMGDLYELRDPGATMIDPETGVSLGTTSSSIGWVVITNVDEKYSEASPIELDRSPAIGRTILRPTDSLPSRLSVSDRATGPYDPPAGYTRDRGGSTTGMTQTADSSTDRPDSVVAIFVSNASNDVPDDRVSLFTAQLTSSLSSRGVRVVSREDVLNAVSSLSKLGPNQGTGESAETRAQRLLSDRASVVALADRLGASAVLKASIDSLMVDVTTTSSLNRTVADYTLAASWTLLASSDGISFGGGSVTSNERFYASPNHERIELNTVDRLLKSDADKISLAAFDGMNAGGQNIAKAEQSIRIEAVLQNMSVPEITQSDKGWMISASSYPLTASDAMISIDGVLVGSTPGPIPVREGTRRIQIEHPLCNPVDRYVDVSEFTGLLRIPVTLSPAGQKQWEQRSRFFESLKDGEVMREVTLDEAEALAEFMRNSRITIDTTNVRNLGVGQPSLWIQGAD